jgi:hypothetical protein
VLDAQEAVELGGPLAAAAGAGLDVAAAGGNGEVGDERMLERATIELE